MCPFDYMAVAVSGKVGPINQVNHTSWAAVVTPTDRLKSVRNRCVIELFVALFVLSLCPFDISVGVGAFVIGLSQISSFFSFDAGFWKSSIQIGGWSFIERSERSCIRNRSGLVVQSGDWSARRTGVGKEERDLNVGSSGIQRGYSGCW